MKRRKQRDRQAHIRATWRRLLAAIPDIVRRCFGNIFDQMAAEGLERQRKFEQMLAGTSESAR